MIRPRPGLFVVLLVLSACAPRLVPPGPLAGAPGEAALTDDALQTSDGISLPLRSWLPAAGPPRAVVVALHGFNDYSNAFHAPGEWLAGQGLAVYAYDQRGFGATPHAGLWPGVGQLVADMATMIAVAHARHPGVPLFILGESMGGAVAMIGLTRAPLDVDGVVLVGPAVLGRPVIPAYQQATLWIAAHTVPWLALTGEGIEVTPSDNIEMLRALSRDPLVIKATRIDSIWGIVDLMGEALAAAPAFDVPTLLLYGARDDIIPPYATLELLRRLPDPPRHPRTVAVYADGYHMLLRDLQGEVVWRDILAWLTDPGAPLPSGADGVDPTLALAD